MAKKLQKYEIQDVLNLKLALENFQRAYYEVRRLTQHIHNEEVKASPIFKEVVQTIQEMPDYREVIGPLDDKFSAYLQELASR